jgi:hypothetical protein
MYQFLRKQLFDDGNVLVFGEGHGTHSTQGNESPNASPTTKLSHNKLQDMINELDFCHSKGKAKNRLIVKKLLMSPIKIADEKFIPLCQGILGTIGNLIVDKSHQSCKEGLPIDMFIAAVVKQLHDDDIIAN